MKKLLFITITSFATLTVNANCTNDSTENHPDKIMHAGMHIPLYTPFVTMYIDSDGDKMAFMIIVGEDEKIYKENTTNNCVNKNCDLSWKIHIEPDTVTDEMEDIERWLNNKGSLKRTKINYQDGSKQYELCSFIIEHKKASGGNFNDHTEAQFKILLGEHPHVKEGIVTHEGGAIHLPSPSTN